MEFTEEQIEEIKKLLKKLEEDILEIGAPKPPK